MKINESISPSVFKNVALVLGLFLAFSLWQFGSREVSDFRYQPVFGEQFANSSTEEPIDLKALPIVLAQSENKGVDVKDMNDLAIEAAFKVPEFVEIEEEVVEPKITMAQQFFARYQPRVVALTAKGAIINGVFWRTGEPLAAMPVMQEDGQYVFPVLAAVSRNQAVIKVSDETVTLPFERF